MRTLRLPLFGALLAALTAAGPALGEAAAPVNGVTDTEIVIGMAGPFSGTAKELGRGMKTGIEIALAAANEAGGVNGRRLRLIAYDDGYEPARTQVAMKELVEVRKVFAIVGNVGTPTAAVAVPYANEKRILFYGAFTGAGLLRSDPPDRYVFNYRASYAEETAAQVKYLVEVRRVRPSQIAVFAQEDSYGDAGFAGVAHMLRRYKRDTASILRVGYKRNTADVSEAVATIRRNASRVQAVVMVCTYRAAAKFIEKLKGAGLNLVFTNVSFVGSTALAEELVQLGPRYAEGVVVTQVVPLPQSNATSVMRYRDLLKKYAPDERPDFVSLEGYIATNVFIEAVRRTGRNLGTDALIDALEGIRGLDIGIGSTIGFGPSEHQGSHKVWGTMLGADGTYKAIDLE